LTTEYAPRKIRFNAVALGATNTEFDDEKKGSPNAQKYIAEMTALGRLAEAEGVGVFCGVAAQKELASTPTLNRTLRNER
jgi:NAD(P)-dependent dehydrogenase (short-subunit alcohol dehydrogenase family)